MESYTRYKISEVSKLEAELRHGIKAANSRFFLISAFIPVVGKKFAMFTTVREFPLMNVTIPTLLKWKFEDALTKEMERMSHEIQQTT